MTVINLLNAYAFTLIGFWRSLRFQFLLIGPWVLMMTVLTLSYTSTLVSYLTVTKLEPIPNSFEELANNLHTKPPLVFEDMGITERIMVFHA